MTLHNLIPTSSFGGAVGIDYGSLMVSSDVTSGSQLLYNQTTFLSQSLFGNQAEVFNLSGSINLTGALNVNGASYTPFSSSMHGLSSSLTSMNVLQEVLAASNSTYMNAATAYNVTTPASGTWTPMLNMTGLLTGTFGNTFTDTMTVQFDGVINIGGTTGQFAAVGLGISTGGAYSIMGSSVKLISVGTTPGMSVTLKPVPLSGFSYSGQTVSFALMCRADNATTNFNMFTAWSILAHHYKQV